MGGNHLDQVESLKITGPNNFEEDFEIESQSASQIIANGVRDFSFVVGEVFSLIISDAHGDSSFQITFELQDGSVTAAKLHHMGAGVGQILKYDGSDWIPTDLGALTYSGNWDADTNTPDLTVGGQPGEYHIVNNAGNFDLNGGTGTDNWDIGDWVIWNEDATRWEKINNATNVTSFNSRNGPVMPQAGDYTWAQIDKSASELSDIADIDVTGLTNGQVLKWNGTTWVAGDDENDGTAGAVTDVSASGPLSSTGGSTPNISITQADAANDGYLNSSDWSSFNSKLDSSGGSMSGNLDMNTNDILDVGTINGFSLSGMSSDISSNTTAISNLDTDDVPEGATNKYFTDAAAQAAAVVNSTAGSETDQAPSVDAIKTYVDSQVASSGDGDFMSDGSVAMTGDFNADGNALTNVSNIDASGNATLNGLFRLKDDDGTDNFVELQAPTNLSADLSFIFPDSNGASGDVLTTDGSGNLSWETPSSGDVTSVSATAPLSNTGTASDPEISISQASTSSDGFLSSTDWDTFNDKQDAITTGSTAQYLRGDLGLSNFEDDVRSTPLTGFSAGAGSVADTDTLLQALNKIVGNIDANTTTISGLDTDDVPEGATNLYFTDAAAQTAAVVNSTAGSETDQAASVDAMKTYVSNEVAGAGDFMKDGSEAMTGDLDLGFNKLLFKSDNSNYVEMIAPTSLGATYTLTLPADDGTSGQVLSTDGAGILSWSDAADSDADITEVTTNAGSALSGGSTSGAVDLSVVTDNSTVTINGSNQLEVGTIGNAQLASDLDASKITAGTLSDSRLSSNVSLFGSSIVNADVDNAAAIAWSKIDKTGADASDVGAAPSTRNIASGDALSGGGDLSADRTLNVNVDDSSIEVNGSNQLQIKDAGVTDAKVASGIDAGKIYQTVESISSSSTLSTNDHNKVILASGDTTLTLPAASTAGSGFKLTVKNIDASNKITIDGDATETIDGEEQKSLDDQYATAELISDGTEWLITYSQGTIGNGSLSCPTGFIAVNGNATFGTDDFCVMKYEAKDVSGVATSQASGNPWVSISAEDAKTECQNLGAEYDLISNPEWMTIARDAESVGNNWSGGTPGSGEMARGWSASTSYDDSWTNSAVAPSTDSSCLYNTGEDTCGSSGDHKYRRTLELSTGEEIWDFSGNVWNWVDWGTAGSFTTGPTDCDASWTEFPSVSCGGLDEANELLPSDGSYDSTESVGQFYGGSGGAALRGGKWDGGSQSGAFALYLYNSPSYASASFGFRCVFRP